MMCYQLPSSDLNLNLLTYLIIKMMLKESVKSILFKFGHLLIYVPLNSIRILLNIFKFIRASKKRVMILIVLVGVITLGRLLVNKATRVRLQN